MQRAKQNHTTRPEVQNHTTRLETLNRTSCAAASSLRGMRGLVVALLALVCVGLALAAGPGKTERRQAREKARHYFSQASRAATEDDAASMYELARKAHRADPTYPEAAMMLAGLRLQMRLDTMTTPAEVRRTLAMAREYVDTYPEDYDESATYAYWCMLADTLPEAIRVYERLDTLFPARHEVLLQLAEAYARSNRGRDAIRTYDRFEEVEGPSPQVGLRKISHYLVERDTVGALAEADSMIRRNTGDPAYLLLRANVQEYLGDSVAALRDYLTAEELYPEASAPKLALATYYASHDRQDLFDRKTYEAMLCEDLELDQKLEMSAQYLSKVINDSTDVSGRSAVLFNSLREQYPHEPKVLELMSSYNQYRKMWPEAIEAMEYAVDLDPANESYWLRTMTLQLQAQDYEGAIATYVRSQKHIPASLDAMTLVGIAYNQSERPGEAIQVYLRALDTLIPGVDPTVPVEDKGLPKVIGPDNSSRVAGLMSLVGDAMHEQGEREKSYVMYENSLLFDDSQPMVYNNYAYFLAIEGGDLEKAARLSSIALALEEGNPTYIDTYAWILYLSGEYEDALRHQLAAVEIAEANEAATPEYYDHLGDIYYRMGDIEEAVANWKKALELSPDDKTIQNKVRQKRVL